MTNYFLFQKNTAMEVIKFDDHCQLSCLEADRLLNVNTCDRNGNTPLIRAAANGDLLSLINVVNAAADVNLSSFPKYGHTALIKAARLGHKACLDFLLK